MKNLIYSIISIALILAFLQPANAISVDEAIETSTDFISEHAKVMHKTVFLQAYNVDLRAVYESDSHYRLLFNINADMFGTVRDRDIMIDMQKSDGKITAVRASKAEKQSLL